MVCFFFLAVIVDWKRFDQLISCTLGCTCTMQNGDVHSALLTSVGQSFMSCRNICFLCDAKYCKGRHRANQCILRCCPSMEGNYTLVSISVDLECAWKNYAGINCVGTVKKKKWIGGASVKVHHNMDAAYSKVTTVSLELFVIFRLSVPATNTYHTVG